jgi:tol-pal system protein YbgF
MAAFLESYPTSRYVPNALYWTGESFYAQSQWDQAILGFKDVVARFPRHDKAADALLKLGMSYEKLNDTENARFHYEALIEDFPASRSAGMARQRMARL